MSIFREVEFEWQGETYTVPATRQMELVGRVEDHLRGPRGEAAAAMLQMPGGPGTVRLARAWGAALRYAGAKVGDDEIFAYIAGEMDRGEVDGMVAISAACLGLLHIVSPPAGSRVAAALATLDDEGDEGAAPEKPEPDRQEPSTASIG